MSPDCKNRFNSVSYSLYSSKKAEKIRPLTEPDFLLYLFMKVITDCAYCNN